MTRRCLEIGIVGRAVEAALVDHSMKRCGRKYWRLAAQQNFNKTRDIVVANAAIDVAVRLF